MSNLFPSPPGGGGAALVATNCSQDNGGCDHECTESEDGQSRTCSCIEGYKLLNDFRKCEPRGEERFKVFEPTFEEIFRGHISAFPPAGGTSCGQLLISRSSYSKKHEGLMPWVLGGEVGTKGESPWQVGELIFSRERAA